MKILNLYAGIGGNRKLWGDDHDITAVEYKPEIAKIYQDFFPNDKVIIADAHQYLLEHFKEFDFIWSSPPCPSHSSINKLFSSYGKNKVVYPDMGLYQEILLLRGYFQGKWCVENVVSWYKPLILPQKVNRHYFWSNFPIGKMEKKSREHYGDIDRLQNKTQFNIKKYKNINIKNKIKVLRNCVEPETGRHILDCAIKSPPLFKEENRGAINPLLYGYRNC
jgi:DNA (cytosine-5)-methyltransferase 1